MPPKWKIWLGKKQRFLFLTDERIVRHIYTPQNFNPATKKLRANLLQFRYNNKTGKNELSCNRIEIESLSHCREVGKFNARPNQKADYYGLACSSVRLIQHNSNFVLCYSPVKHGELDNYSHCDIWDEGNPPIVKGQALSASMNLEREEFLKKWKTHFDIETLLSKDMLDAPSENE